MNETDKLAEVLWNYMKLDSEITKSDLILVLGNHNLKVAERAAELYLENYAPMILFSGSEGVGRKVSGFDGRSEAEVFTERAIELGVPIEDMLIENQAKNTGENIRFSIELLAQKGIEPNSIIAVQKPYMERRTLATLLAQWPKPQPLFQVTSPKLSYEQYTSDPLYPKDYTINVMVGDLQRIKEYPKLGFQVEQEIPDDVWRAFEKLVELGYDKNLIQT